MYSDQETSHAPMNNQNQCLILQLRQAKKNIAWWLFLSAGNKLPDARQSVNSSSDNQQMRNKRKTAGLELLAPTVSLQSKGELHVYLHSSTCTIIRVPSGSKSASRSAAFAYRPAPCNQESRQSAGLFSPRWQSQQATSVHYLSRPSRETCQCGAIKRD